MPNPLMPLTTVRVARGLQTVAAGAAVFFAGGCGEDEVSSGALVVPFQLGNDKSCEEVGVDFVLAELDGGYLEQMVDCTEGQVRFTSVPEGSYSIVLYGLSGGFPVMDSLEGDEVIARVAGQGNTTTISPDVVLTSAPAKLEVRWDFGFSSCQTADVDAFRVMAWETNGSDRLLQGTLDCTQAGEGANNYRTLEDPDRKLAGELLGEVSIQPLDGNGEAFGDVVTFKFEPPGAGHPVRLSIECDSMGCEGSGEPD